MSNLSKEERAWLKKLQNLLDACPSSRLGFYTTGDPVVTVYDYDKETEINDIHNGEFANAVDECDARLGELIFPNFVHSTAG